MVSGNPNATDRVRTARNEPVWPCPAARTRSRGALDLAEDGRTFLEQNPAGLGQPHPV
ncbi:hypothetical protein Pd630_LPD12029 (plasmid) [Rhodococcus opacus PD630]|nr:hypothetical protein Pd630_LPD12029 [Rhodococcus opacus PD630]